MVKTMNEVDDRDLTILFLIDKVPVSICYEFHALIPWSSCSTATPLSDLRDVQVFCKNSLEFLPDRDAWMYMNQSTFDAMLGNKNAADLYGRRTQGTAFECRNYANSINDLLFGDDLPSIRVVSSMKDGIATIVCPKGFIIMHVN